MIRIALRAFSFIVLASIVLSSVGQAQPGLDGDRVYFIEKKDGSVRDAEATLKASATGYQIFTVADKKTISVSATDIIRVVPAKILNYDRIAIMEPVNFELKKEWEKARIGHAKMLKEASSAPEKVRKYLEYSVAICAAHAASDTADDTAAAKTEEAIKLLDAFLLGHKTGWEVWSAGQTCARLQITTEKIAKEGDKETPERLFAGAARSWERVGRATDLAADLKTEAILQQIDNTMRAHLYVDARSLVDDALKTAPEGAAKERLGLYQMALKAVETNPLEPAKAIEEAINKSTNPHVRATGYGILGELYLAANKPRDAMWKFLWVEVVYNQDRDEVIKALARLADSFQLQGDEERAKSYREKARRFRGG